MSGMKALCETHISCWVQFPSRPPSLGSGEGPCAQRPVRLWYCPPVMYRQCTLQRGQTCYHAWLPETLAKVGKMVYWNPNEMWKVISAGENSVSGDYVRELERDYLHQRKASDI
jgi:hypothetical protein